ncbi:MAG: InlB B-repeat-containing protein [Firmicutes bacterium]|nr:InlB B-repeat-containing protein [Bacillota bacterium]
MKIKRVFAMLVAFMMVFTMLPANILADGEGTYTVNRTIKITGPGTVKSLLYDDEKTFEHSGEGTAEYTHTVQVPVGKACAYQLEAVSSEAYAFDGWYKNGELYYSLFQLPVGQPSYVLNQGAGDTFTIDTVEAKFVARTYSVKIHFEAEEGGSVDPVLYTKDNIPAATWESFSSTATPDKNHDFAGWYYNGELFTEDETMTDSVNSTYLYDLIERTYTAKFTPTLYEVVFMIVTENEGTHYLSRKMYPYGTPAAEIKVPATPEREGYAFLCWREGTAEDAPLIHDVTGPAAYYPHYTKDLYTVDLSFNTEGDGTVSLESYTKNVPLGESTEVSCTASPSEGNRFIGWYKGDALYTDSETMTASFCSSVLNEHISEIYTAKFEAIEYSVTVESGSGSGTYTKGEDVAIKADAPAEGQRFRGWTGADGLVFTSGSAKSPEAVFTMPAGDVTLAATYGDLMLDWSSLKEALESGESVTLYNDVTRDAEESINIGSAAALDLNGHSVYGYAEDGDHYDYTPIIIVEDGGMLTVSDSSEGQSGSLAKAWGTCIIRVDGSLVLEAGTITKATGGVDLVGSGRFTMKGGKITGNAWGVDILSGTASIAVSGDVDISGNATDVTLCQSDPSSFNPIYVEGRLSDAARIGVYTDAPIDAFQGKALAITEGLKANGSKENFLLMGRDDIRIGTLENGELVLSAPRTLSLGEDITAVFGGSEYTGSVTGPVVGDEVELRFGGEVPEGVAVRYTIEEKDTYILVGTVSYPGAASEDGKYAVLRMPDCDAAADADIYGLNIPDGIIIEESFAGEGSSLAAVIDRSSGESINIPYAIEVDGVTVEGFTIGQAATLMLPFSAVYTDADSIGAVFYSFSGVEYDEAGQKWTAGFVQVQEGTVLEANTPYIIVPLRTSLTFSSSALLSTEGGGEQQTAADDWAVKGVYKQTDMTGAKEGYGFVSAGEEGGVDRTVDSLGCYLSYIDTGAGTKLPETIEVCIEGSGEALGQFVRFVKENPSTDPGDPNGDGNGNGSGDTGSGNGTGNGSGETGPGKPEDKAEGGKDKETETEPVTTLISPGPDGGTDNAGGQEVLTTGAVDTESSRKNHTLLWIGIAAVVILAAGGWYLLKRSRKE